MRVSPMYFLALLIVVTAAARLFYAVLRQRHRRALQELAQQWRMHYSQRDRFDLSDRVAALFPLPGAAEMRVVDVIYGTEIESATSDRQFYRYIFSAEYTAGVTRAKHRYRRVVTFREPKGRTTRADWS